MYGQRSVTAAWATPSPWSIYKVIIEWDPFVKWLFRSLNLICQTFILIKSNVRLQTSTDPKKEEFPGEVIMEVRLIFAKIAPSKEKVKY